jgi:hypothetical protein
MISAPSQTRSMMGNSIPNQVTLGNQGGIPTRLDSMVHKWPTPTTSSKCLHSLPVLILSPCLLGFKLPHHEPESTLRIAQPIHRMENHPSYSEEDATSVSISLRRGIDVLRHFNETVT